MMIKSGGKRKQSLFLLTWEAGGQPPSQGVYSFNHIVFVQRRSVRVGMMVGERASQRYLHEGCRRDPLCVKASCDLCLEHKTWGIFLYPTYYHAIRIIFSTEGIPFKRFAYFCQEKAQM